MALETYKRKRDFTKTSEPEGKVIASQGKLMYSSRSTTRPGCIMTCVWNGTGFCSAGRSLKGPSMDPADKRWSGWRITRLSTAPSKAQSRKANMEAVRCCC